MSLMVQAIYENGVLKPVQPLPLHEHEKVEISITPTSNWVLDTAGIMGWRGSAEVAEQFASDPELDFPPPPESA